MRTEISKHMYALLTKKGAKTSSSVIAPAGSTMN